MIKVTAEPIGFENLQQMIRERVRLLGETAKQATNASAQILIKSIRALTKVAKLGRMKLEVEGNIVVSYRRERGQKTSVPCLRWRGSKSRFYAQGNQRIIIKKSALVNVDAAKVYSFTSQGEPHKKYFIATATRAEANKIAKALAGKYKGLARLAWTKLAVKLFNSQLGGGSQRVSEAARKVAERETSIRRIGQNTIILEDNLDYAALAFEHGISDLEIAEQKACNSIGAIIERKLANKGLSERVSTPIFNREI